MSIYRLPVYAAVLVVMIKVQYFIEVIPNDDSRVRFFMTNRYLQPTLKNPVLNWIVIDAKGHNLALSSRHMVHVVSEIDLPGIYSMIAAVNDTDWNNAWGSAEDCIGCATNRMTCQWFYVRNNRLVRIVNNVFSSAGLEITRFCRSVSRDGYVCIRISIS